jgi:hypothetical protein
MWREQPKAALPRSGRSGLSILSSLLPTLKTSFVTACLVATALLWANSRILALRKHQDPEKPIVLSAYYVYHGMAAALEEGRVGQLDLERYQRYVALGNPSAVYGPLPTNEAPHFVDYYTLDIGYSFLVELARLAFPALPDNHLRSLALQLVVDAALVVFMYFFFAAWDPALGALAALLYSGNKVFCWLVSFAFYYYWDIPLSFAALGLLLLAYRHPPRARFWLGSAGFLLGFGVWLRASWWPLTGLLGAIVLLTPRLRRTAPWLLLIFGLVAAPQVYRSSRARGSLALSTRASWHVALVGLGYYPNPYGLEARDESVFRLMHEKYGSRLRTEDYAEHDQAARKEYLSILRQDPQFVLRSFLGRLRESLLGTTATSLAPYPVLSGVLYRLLCLGGLAMMMIAGGESRWLGLTAAGTYAVYVLVTAVFYFVGLAYDNVSQVALFVIALGGLGAASRVAHDLIGKRRPRKQDAELSPPVAASE